MSTSKVWSLSLGMVGVASLVVACSSTEGGPSVAPVESVPAPTASAPAPTASAPTSSPEGGADDGGRAFDESVRVRTEPCEKAAPQATRCESYEIVCGGASPAVVDVAYFEPPAGVAKKGVVLFGSGGGGTGFYNFPARDALTGAGYTLVDRRWTADRGWFDGAKAGPQEAACRYAALARYVKRTHAPSVPLCATGNSGGSAELVYALAWNGLASSLAFAMPTSGPFHRLDLFCQGQTDSAWVTETSALWSACPGCVGKGTQAGGGVISLLDASFGGSPMCSSPGAAGLATLLAKSPVKGPDVPRMGRLPVHLKVGALDEAAYPIFSAALHRELGAAGVNVSYEVLAGVGHEMDKYDEGVKAIRDSLLTGCK